MLQAAMPHAIPNHATFMPVSQPLPSSVPTEFIPVPGELASPFPQPVVSTEAPVQQHAAFSHPQDYSGMVPTIMECSQPGSREGIVHLQAVGYTVQQPQMSGPDDADAFFSHTVFPDPGFYMQHGFSVPFADLAPEMGDSFNPYLHGSNVPVQSIEGGQLSLPTVPSSASLHSAPSIASTYSHSNFTDESNYVTAASSSSPCDPLDGPGIEPSTIQPPPESSDAWDTPVLSSPSESTENAQDDAHGSPLNLPKEAFTRRNSSTSALADSMSTVGINVQGTESDFKTPSQQLSLAARRQRPRPTQLGLNSLRSASHSAGMPASPGANQNLAAPDQALRRIRSNCATNGGRIQKPGSSSGQKSPMTLAFTDAAASPKWARYPSGSSYFSSPPISITASSLAPPTPNTPNDVAHWPPWQSPIAKTCAHSGDVNATGVAVSYPEGMTNPAMMTFSSPPTTPLDPEQHAQYQAYLKQQQQALYRDTPPQSAPATQQAFAPTPFATAQPMPPSVSINGDKAGHFRSPSLPDGPHAFPAGADMQWPPMPMFNTIGDPQVSAPMHANVTNGTEQSPTDSMSRPVQFSNPFTLSAGHTSVIKADFSVHQYTPPDANGAVPAPLPRQESVPKIYHFSNHGPRDFKSQ